MNRKRRTMLSLLLPGMLAGIPGAVGQQPADAAFSFGEIVDVQLVNVEVWVTDPRGLPVTGLTVDDFEVREDGEPVEVSYFAEIRSPVSFPELAPPISFEAPVERPSAPGPIDVADAGQGSGETPGFLVIYFDELFSTAVGRRQLVEDLRDFLELRRVRPEQVLILRQDDDLRVEAYLGSSAAELDAALDRLEEISPRGAQTWAEERNAMRRLQDEWEKVTVLGGAAPGVDPCDFFAQAAFREVQFQVNVSRARIEQTLAHLGQAASFLAGLPGLKTLVYVSDGLTVTPGTNLMAFARQLCPGRQEERRLDLHDGLAEPFRRLTRHANANRVTIYTIQSSGLRSLASMGGADERGLRNVANAMGQYDTATRTTFREGLAFLAEETGGRAIFNKSRFIEDFEQIGEDMSTYYSLAYAPPHGGDGLEHRIQVRVRDGRKVSLRHRPGYRDKGPDQRLLERLEGTLYLNLMSNPLAVRLGAGAVEPAPKERFTVPLHVVVPVERITFLPRGDAAWARLRVVVLAQDERHGRTAFRQEVYDLGHPGGSADNVSLVLTVELAQGIHVVAVGVRDEASQETSYVATALELQPGPAADDGAG